MSEQALDEGNAGADDSIVGLVIHNAHTVWPMDKLLFTSADVDVEVLEQIDTSTWSVQRAQEHANGVREVIAAAIAAHKTGRRDSEKDR